MVGDNITRLMEIIGFPQSKVELVENAREDYLLNFLPLAIENKVPLFFLERAVTICKGSKILEAHHETYIKRARSFFDLLNRISGLLTKIETNFVVFKTFRPFPFVTVDLDILFFTREEFLRAYHELRQFYTLAGYGPYSISLHSPKHDIILDLHLEISVSRMVYVNKQLLRRFVTEFPVNGNQTYSLELPAALATVVAHSLYKEQMLTLSDYYTTLTQILQMTPYERRILADLAEQLNIGLSVNLVLRLVDFITKIVFKKSASVISETAEMIEIDEVEEKAIQIAVNQFVQRTKLPLKYHPFSVALAFMKKAFKDPLLRATLGNQFFDVITNRSGFLESALLHARRTAYF